MSRRLALVLLVVLAVPALALAADTDPKRKINPADERKAASIVFKRTDFAAAGSARRPRATTTTLNCSVYDPDGSDLTLTGDAEAEFERTGGFPSVLSYADIYATSKDAAAAWTRTVKPALGALPRAVLPDGGLGAAGRRSPSSTTAGSRSRASRRARPRSGST